ncbi:hypothetical protein FHW67_002957 [Herbaspirillum sp. Sphag1AN]|uniref:hypothetical protein n=1 Tax=unclassified Herbaspirillum TaxID=2624150 RepID=UPI00161A46A7|nr:MULTISPECIES: hypothetical protein [unclassified Herbaspirillum]MBB3213659.1 hypothetical protein [Herbaspirillum sp. Sphag1AN]MBB3246857.1 hypothetical protein [Herbaspirillum sp. Sphag64]
MQLQSIPVHVPHAPLRKECPAGACVCQRELLEQDPTADMRILMLTQEQEKRLIERIARIISYADLQHVVQLLQSQLGVVLRIMPGPREVRTVRGFIIQLEDQPGLCKKTRQAIPAAIRKCLEQQPQIAYAILDTHDLLGASENAPQQG